VAWAGASELFVAAVSALILLLCIRPSRDSSVVNPLAARTYLLSRF